MAPVRRVAVACSFALVAVGELFVEDPARTSPGRVANQPVLLWPEQTTLEQAASAHAVVTVATGSLAGTTVLLNGALKVTSTDAAFHFDALAKYALTAQLSGYPSVQLPSR